MQISALEELATEAPAEAEAAVATLVNEADVESLAQIAERGRVPELRLRAVQGLGEVGDAAAGAALVGLLEQANTEAVEGGTEQRLEHERMRAQLVRALSQARGVRAPDPRDRRAVSEFLEDCRGG